MEKSVKIERFLTKCVRLTRIYKDSNESKIFEKMNSSEKYVEQFKTLPNPPVELVELLKSEGLL